MITATKYVHPGGPSSRDRVAQPARDTGSTPTQGPSHRPETAKETLMPTDAFDMAIVHNVLRSELHDLPALIRGVMAGESARSAVVGSKLHCRAPEFAEAVAHMEQAHRAIAAAHAKVKSVLTSWVCTAEEWQQCAARGSEFISRKNLRLGLVLGGLIFDASSADETRRILTHVPRLQRILIRLLARRTLDRYRAVLYGTQATALSTRHGVQGRGAAEPSALEIIENFRWTLPDLYQHRIAPEGLQHTSQPEGEHAVLRAHRLRLR